MDFINYTVEGPVAVIAHNRPEARNAESRRLLDEMEVAFQQAIADPAVKVIILGSEGAHFSAGHDVKEAQAERAHFTVEERFAYEEIRYFRYAMTIYDCPKPVIARVQGACIAGGFMVANMADLIVAADDAFFADPVGRSMGAAAVEILVHPWVLSQRAAREMLYTGEKITAERAAHIGMVNRVVPRAMLEAETTALALKIAETDGFTLKLMKRSLNRTADIQGFRAALEAHFDTHQLSHVAGAFRRAADTGLAGTISAAKGR